MVFNLFSAPCFGAIAAMKRELGGTKRVLKAIIFQTVLAWILAMIIYQVGSRIELGTINWANVIVISVIFVIILYILISKKSEKDECSRCPYCSSCSKR